MFDLYSSVLSILKWIHENTFLLVVYFVAGGKAQKIFYMFSEWSTKFLVSADIYVVHSRFIYN